MDGDKEHWTLELDSETSSDSQSWKSWKNHGHLCSSAGKADETEEEEATRTYVTQQPQVRKKKTELRL